MQCLSRYGPQARSMVNTVAIVGTAFSWRVHAKASMSRWRRTQVAMKSRWSHERMEACCYVHMHIYIITTILHIICLAQAIILVFDGIIVCQANNGTDLGRDTLSDAAVRVGCLQTSRKEKRKRHIFLEVIHVQLNISPTQLCALVSMFSYHVARKIRKWELQGTPGNSWELRVHSPNRLAITGSSFFLAQL